MTKEELKCRTKTFAVSVIKFVETLPKNKANDVIAYQIIKSATSVGANYRSACRGRSTAEFVSKLNIVIEEADETSYWLEIIEDTNLIKDKDAMNRLYKESNELTAIFTASSKTIKANTANQKLENKN
ncbi:MAG TPA: four helix bundle protein [Bacteroidia bacterium]|nr:four helix bundle protein [Bacteroidia bacterium]